MSAWVSCGGRRAHGGVWCEGGSSVRIVNEGARYVDPGACPRCRELEARFVEQGVELEQQRELAAARGLANQQLMQQLDVLQRRNRELTAAAATGPVRPGRAPAAAER